MSFLFNSRKNGKVQNLARNVENDLKAEKAFEASLQIKKEKLLNYSHIFCNI